MLLVAFSAPDAIAYVVVVVAVPIYRISYIAHSDGENWSDVPIIAGGIEP